MKAFLLTTLALATAWTTFGQALSARKLTERVAPQRQPAPPLRQPQYGPVPRAGGAVRPASPAETAKLQAEKAKNEAKQFEFFKRRAEEGSDHAQYELGMRYLAGKGTAKDEKLGRKWLEKSAKQGNRKAAKELAELPPMKAVASVDQDKDQDQDKEKAKVEARK